MARLGQPLYLHVAPDGYPEKQDDWVNSGAMTANTERVIREQLQDLDDPVQARALAVGLALGGPEFQRQ